MTAKERMTNGELQKILKRYPDDFEINILTELTGIQIQDVALDVAVSTTIKRVIIIGTEQDEL